MSHVGALSLMVIIRRWRLPTICITVGTLSIQWETLACWCYKYMRWIGLYVGAQMATKDQCRLDCSVSFSYAAATLITWTQRTAQPLNELDINIWDGDIHLHLKLTVENRWMGEVSLRYVASECSSRNQEIGQSQNFCWHFSLSMYPQWNAWKYLASSPVCN